MQSQEIAKKTTTQTFTETLRHPAVYGIKREVARRVTFTVRALTWDSGRVTGEVAHEISENGVIVSTGSDGTPARAAKWAKEEHGVDLTDALTELEQIIAAHQ